MNTTPTPENEALCILMSPTGWMLTAAFRHGSPESLLERDMGCADEFRDTPIHLRTASLSVSQPCVTFQADEGCVIESAAQVRGLASWLIAASIAMERMEKDGTELS